MNGKWVIRAVLLVLLALNVTACRCGAPAPGAAADLSAERTKVEFRRPGEAVKEVSGSQSEPVGTGDQINTDGYGVGILKFSAFLRVKVFRKSELQVKAAPDPNASPIVKLYLALGTTHQELQRQANQVVDVTTETDWATIRATATAYLVSVDDDEVTWVVVFDGAVEAEAQGQMVVVRAGQATWVEPGQPPHSPIEVDLDEVQEWLERLGGTGEVEPIRPVVVPPEEGDGTGPWLKVGHSPSGPDEEQAVTVVAEAGDGESGLARIEIQMPGQRLVICRESPCEATGGPYPAGEYGYEVRAFDNADNATYREGRFAVTAAVVHDNPPVVEGIYVEPAAIYQREQFRRTLVASDDIGLESIWWQMKGTGDDHFDSGVEADCGGITRCERNWSLEWTGRGGEFPVYARARDVAGQLSNMESTTIAVLAPPAAARFSLSIGGGPFNNKLVQEAVGFAINWAALQDEIGEVVLVDFLSGETLAGPTEPAYDPERAKQLLAEAGYPDGFSMVLLFDPGDELANKLAEWVASYLKVIIGSEFVGVAPADARAKLASMIEAGESGLLTERR